MQISYLRRYWDRAKEWDGAHGEDLVSWAHLSSEVDIILLVAAEIVASIENSNFLVIGIENSVFTAETANPVMAAVGDDLPSSSFFCVDHIMAAAR
jgi:hypothetical protein